MTEREMEDLLWHYPQDLLREPLRQHLRQPVFSTGRADLVFTDRLGDLLVVEIKRGVLPRSALAQVLDYFGPVKASFPNTRVELMVVANVVPPERRLTLENRGIECREISEQQFRVVAGEKGYTFESERKRECDGNPEMAPTLAVVSSDVIAVAANNGLGRPSTRARYTIFGNSVASVINWLGVEGFTVEEVISAFSALGHPLPKLAYIKACLRDGPKHKGTDKERSHPIAVLTDEQKAQFLQFKRRK